MALKKNTICYISNNDGAASKLMRDYGMQVTFDHTSDGIELAVFTGGADICPFLYGERVHKTTSFDLSRDQEEITAWKYLSFHNHALPKIGICRGMQLGNVLLGGSLFQDVDKHGSLAHEHKVKIFSEKGDRFSMVNSCHHQMCIPASDMRILASANEASKHTKFDRTFLPEKNKWQDIEAIYHSACNFLGVQWHPEWTHKGAKETFEELLYENLLI